MSCVRLGRLLKRIVRITDRVDLSTGQMFHHLSEFVQAFHCRADQSLLVPEEEGDVGDGFAPCVELWFRYLVDLNLRCIAALVE